MAPQIPVSVPQSPSALRPQRALLSRAQGSSPPVKVNYIAAHGPVRQKCRIHSLWRANQSLILEPADRSPLSSRTHTERRGEAGSWLPGECLTVMALLEGICCIQPFKASAARVIKLDRQIRLESPVTVCMSCVRINLLK